MMRLFRNRKGFTLIELMIVIAIIAILAAILVPNFIKARAQSQWTACQSNLKNIATALEMYSTDHNGHYPATGALADLTTSTYLKQIPTCPSLGSDTYSANYAGAQNPDAFTDNCNGSNHTTVGAGANKPEYTSVGGLVAK